ncbi:MAG: WD40 repeat domain-containing protein [Acidimicrobiia bacterium]
MAALSTDGRIDLWATDGFQHIASMQAPDWGPGASLAFSADSSLLISTEESGGGRGSVRWWDVDTARQVRSRLVPTFAPLVAFWDTELVALDVTGALHHFDVASGELVRTEDDVVPVNEGGINLAVSRDGSTLVISSAVETVIRTSTGESRLELNGWATPSQDGTLIAVANLDGEVTLVRTGDGTTVAELRGHTAAIESVEFSPTGTDLITTSADSTAIRWDLAAARPTEVLRGHSGRVTGVAVAPDGVSAFTSGLDGTVIGWDLSGAFRLDRRLWSVEPPVWGAIAVGGTRRMLLLGPERARLVDTASGTVVGSVPGEWWTGSTLPDDPKVALGGRDVVVFDTNTGDVTRIPSPFESDGVGWLALSPDGTLAVTSPSGLVVLTPEASPRWLNASRSWGVDYNDSGTLLAAGRQDGSVAIWDTATWTLRSTIPPVGQRDPILGLRFSPEGQLVTHNLEGPIRVWNVDHGTQTSDALSAHSGFVGHVDFSPTQPLMLSVGSDGRIGLWDTETWSLYGGLLSGPAATPGWAWFTQDGAIIAVFEDGAARRWPVEADEWERRACAIAGRSLTIEEWTEFAPDWPQPDATC